MSATNSNSKSPIGVKKVKKVKKVKRVDTNTTTDATTVNATTVDATTAVEHTNTVNIPDFDVSRLITTDTSENQPSDTLAGPPIGELDTEYTNITTNPDSINTLDMSYKKTAHKTYYDIEILQDLYTIATINQYENKINVAIITEQAIDTTLIEQTVEHYKTDPIVLDVLTETPTINIMRLHPVDDVLAIIDLHDQIIYCQNWSTPNQFTNWYGWNSSNYDLIMIAAARTLASDGQLSLQALKYVSNTIIETRAPNWKIPELFEKSFGARFVATLKKTINRAAYANGHIDVAVILKTGDVDGDAGVGFTPSLKREMAKKGLDIVIDDVVTDVNARGLTDVQIAELVDYNINDVVGTMVMANTTLAVTGLDTLDGVREMFPYTDARSLPYFKRDRYHASERTITPPQLAQLVLIGPKRVRPVDAPTVGYRFPLPSGERDLLDFILEREKFMHPNMRLFFEHFRGQKMQTQSEVNKVSYAQPVSRKGTLHVPWYRDGKPTDGYITVSTGGAHGGIWPGLSKMSEEEVDVWMRASASQPAKIKPTTDTDNVIHLDWTSFYPVLCTKLRIFETPDGHDYMTQIFEERRKTKAIVEANPDPSSWTADVVRSNAVQASQKLIMNSGTGAANTKRARAKLPLDNKIQSMRLIGNLNMWVLGQRLVEAGAFVLSVNTDGIYVTNLSLEDVRVIVGGYVDDYGLGVEPEVVERFISRDTSSRVEVLGGRVKSASGVLTHGRSLGYSEKWIGRNVAVPSVVTWAAVQYMVRDRGWLLRPVDRGVVEGIVMEAFGGDVSAWYHVHSGTAARRLTLDGRPLGKVNRLVFVKPGTVGSGVLGSLNARALTKDMVAAWAGSGLGFGEWCGVVGLECASVAPVGSVVVSARRVVEGREVSFVEDGLLDLVRGDGVARALRLFYRDGDVFVGVTVWGEGKVAGYTSDVGLLLNGRDSLVGFDWGVVDVGAYVDWCCGLVEGWRVGGVVPELGLTGLSGVGGSGGSAGSSVGLGLLAGWYGVGCE